MRLNFMVTFLSKYVSIGWGENYVFYDQGNGSRRGGL